MFVFFLYSLSHFWVLLAQLQIQMTAREFTEAKQKRSEPSIFFFLVGPNK